MSPKLKKITRRLLWPALAVFVCMNVVAWFHASKFTRFDPSLTSKTKDGHELSFAQKLGTLVFGVKNPRPANTSVPSQSFKTVRIKSNKTIECWYIAAPAAKGTVAIFHGYSGKKSAMLDKSDVFLGLGYNTLLVDFMGSGGSESNETTIGYHEGEQVKAAFDYLQQKGERNIVLFGTSMGAAAIMKAQCDYSLACSGIVIECPFGTLLQTVQSRFADMHVPAFPMANLLVLWGGVQNGFNGFSHNPRDYASGIRCPTLLLYGGRDEKVSAEETNAICANLKGYRQLRTYPLARHENYLRKYRREWTEDIRSYLKYLESKPANSL